MAQKLSLGIIGMSEGNGHPYSWSAIFNGYNQQYMSQCPFATIPQYLSERHYPNDFLSEYGEVTCIYTQDLSVSQHIAKASNINSCVDKPEDMIGKVDAVLLARDDAENHYEMTLPYLQAGLPVFIDKPLALSVAEAEKIFAAEQFPGQVFSCTSLRYADELMILAEEKNRIGDIKYVEASVPKKWDTYAIHTIEPIVLQFPDRGKLVRVTPRYKEGVRVCIVEWENLMASIKATGNTPSSIKINYLGQKGTVEKIFADSFKCFKRSLREFIAVVNKQSAGIAREETLEIVSIIEKGRL